MSRLRAPNKEVREVLVYAKQHGFSIVQGRKHYKLRRGKRIVIVSITPSCPYGPSNALHDINRILMEESNGI